MLEDAPYIDDAGFSDRVARALPRRKSRRVSYLVVPGFATLGCVLAFVLSRRTLGGGTHGGHHAWAMLMTTSFVGMALAFLLVASTALLASDE